MHKILISAVLVASTSFGAASAKDAEVSQARQRADIEKLVSFGTRHTLSSQTDPKRGIGAARRWAEAEFRRTGKACGNCLTIALPETMVSGTRIPTPVRLVDVVAIQRGTERPDEVVIVQGHLDSRVTDVMDATKDAPGANDDGSGVSLVIEAARVLSQRKFPRRSFMPCSQGRSRGSMAASCWRTMRKSRAGRSRRCSTTTSSAAAVAPTG
jgi:hypothetical protein